jgi:gas vesicle protein
MGKDPGVIRAEIEQTRQRVGDEVDAISYKTDVGARASDYVDDKKGAVKSKVTGAKDTVTGAMPDPRKVKRGATHVRDTAASNPLGLAVGGLAVGFLVGTLLPKTDVENEQMGEMSDRLMDAAKETASDAVGRGKQVAQEAVGSAVDTAKESGREQGEELSSSLKDRAQEQSPGAA